MQDPLAWPSPYRSGPIVPYAAPFPTRRLPRPSPFRPRELAAALVVVAGVDVALWSRGLASGGLGLGLFFLVTPLCVYAAARFRRRSTSLRIVLGLLALVVGRCVYNPTFATVLAGLGLLLAFALVLRSRRLFVPDLALAGLVGITQMPSRASACVRGTKRLAARTRLGGVSLLPIVVPAALVAIFLGVFALANPIVAHALALVGDVIARLAFVPSVGRVVLWTASILGAASLLRPAGCRLRGYEAAEPSSEATPTALLVARNTLAGLNVLFLGYNVLDARYLWAGSPPSGITTQVYAHQGAFWLTIALLMLTAVVGVMFKGSLAHDPRAETARVLSYVWIAQGGVLALATYRRIGIHIAKSGLSDLRIVGILGTSLVVCGVVLVALKLRHTRTFTWLVRRQLDALALTSVLYVVAPTHLLSATINVTRVRHGEYRPLLHTFRQSHETESAAAFLPLLDHPDIRVRQGVAALLADERGRLRAAFASRRTWRERDLATTSSLGALERASARIDHELGDVAPDDARRVLFEISRVANEDRSLEELFAIPAASDMRSRTESATY
jgi:hypothetical protein